MTVTSHCVTRAGPAEGEEKPSAGHLEQVSCHVMPQASQGMCCTCESTCEYCLSSEEMPWPEATEEVPDSEGAGTTLQVHKEHQCCETRVVLIGRGIATASHSWLPKLLLG